MDFQTRKPSGKAAFPLILLAGVEGAGKTWAAVEATGMEEVGRAFFIEVGESQADAYGAVPGADFEIIEHDGTLGQIRGAIQWAAQQPAPDGKYNMLIIDSMTEIWGLLQDNAQDEANRRARNRGKNVPEEGARITMDLWNKIKETWGGILSQCRQFRGPVLLTARLELVTAMDDKGNPTRDKMWKVQAEKNLPFHTQVVLHARRPRQWTMTKIATTVPELQLPVGGEMAFKDFAVAKLLTAMGVGPDTPATSYVETRVDGQFNDEVQQQREEQENRRQYVKQAAEKLMQLEQAGDFDKIRQGIAFYDQRGDKELIQMATATLERMTAAQGSGEVVQGEVVDGPPQ
ncbi:hypothetical protein CPHO_08475 [Corynebacterium phocae]|uniref:Uncharacterized protein n=1 Tax=Corynebacterium phocae TaxID=161895 RepID=A0A1L7D4I0_9CORY|nr:AAA family ATPase [Corynebacterium phocae]APT92913.1 hypothetical protein CPHO_08475 [Corynebacterium phocae]KAA8723242.1 AAA family ATPase [Corynebacterium phocae]